MKSIILVVMTIILWLGFSSQVLTASQKTAYHDPRLAGGAFHVLVNYDLRLDAAIKEGKYEWVNEIFTEKGFPATRKGVVELDIVLVNLNRDISPDDAINELDKLGFRPAELRELLALGAKYPDEQRKYTIIASGSAFHYPDGARVVPYLWGLDGERDLDSYWSGIPRSSDTTRFAGVRK